MPFICTICTGSLEKNPDDPAAFPGAGCLSCGHVFHQFCIEKWLASGSEKLCPMCRKAVPERHCLSLFHDFEEPSVLLYPSVPTSDLKAAEEREADMQKKLSAALKEQKALKQKFRTAQHEIRGLRRDLKTVHAEKLTVTHKFLSAKEEAKYWQTTNTQSEERIKSLEKKIHNLERAAERPIGAKVTPVPKMKPSATVTSKTPSESPAPTVPATSRSKNVAMKAVPADLPKPKTTTASASTKASASRKTGGQTSA